MNLWLRLLWLIVTAHRRPGLGMPEGVSEICFRVWPHDLDPSLHMNNGRYLGIMDLGRLDVIIRSGLWRAVMRHRWTPIASAAVIRFRRELRLFDRYRLETRILAWDELAVVMEQVFLFAGGPRDGQVAARALFKGGIYDRGGAPVRADRAPHGRDRRDVGKPAALARDRGLPQGGRRDPPSGSAGSSLIAFRPRQRARDHRDTRGGIPAGPRR